MGDARLVRFAQIEKFQVRIKIFSMGISNHESRLNNAPNSQFWNLGNWYQKKIKQGPKFGGFKISGGKVRPLDPHLQKCLLAVI